MWKFLTNKTSGTLFWLYLSSKSLPGVLEERGFLTNLDMVSYDIYQPSAVKNFIQIQHQEACQDSVLQASWVLEERKVLMNLEIVSYNLYQPSEDAVKNFIKFQHQEPYQVSTCPPSLFLKSWRTWRFLTNLEMVSDELEHPYDPSVRVSSRTNICKTSTWHIQH